MDLSSTLSRSGGSSHTGLIADDTSQRWKFIVQNIVVEYIILRLKSSPSTSVYYLQNIQNCSPYTFIHLA